ncbi:MAG: hypothetical protein KDB07_11980, partial [Planctomycetes bacterium]|nr:hypothetical protein [Planctomycetota bacterium]
MRFLNVVALCAALLVSALACSKHEVLTPESTGASAVTYSELTINGKALKGMVADNFADRVRAESAVALSENSGQFACLIYGPREAGGGEEALELAHDFKRSGELVFINKAGEAVKVYAGDNAYLPPALKNAATRYQAVPVFYKSDKPASIALYLEAGQVANLGIKAGSKVSFGEDLLSKVAQADPSGVKLYFLDQSSTDETREKRPDPVSVITRVATSNADRAKNIRKGEGPLLLLWPDNDETLVNDGYWLKGVEGEYSIAFMRLQASYQTASTGEAKPMTGFVIDIVEGVSDSGDNDLERPRWWPSEERVTRTLRTIGFSANGVVNAVLVMPGKSAFTDKKIKVDMPCQATSLLIPTNVAADQMPAPLANTVVEVAGQKLLPNLVRADADD